MGANRSAVYAMSQSLRELREERGLDQTLQNLLRALTLNLELRARYRVFEFEAPRTAAPRPPTLFRELREIENGQINALLVGLRDRLGDIDIDVDPLAAPDRGADE